MVLEGTARMVQAARKAEKPSYHNHQLHQLVHQLGKFNYASIHTDIITHSATIRKKDNTKWMNWKMIHRIAA